MKLLSNVFTVVLAVVAVASLSSCKKADCMVCTVLLSDDVTVCKADYNDDQVAYDNAIKGYEILGSCKNK